MTSLPQDPKADPSKRKKQLAEAQKDYRWSTEVRPGNAEIQHHMTHDW